MQVVIMCGGTGTRLKEQTEFVPKPLIPIGGIPMMEGRMRKGKFGFDSHDDDEEYEYAGGIIPTHVLLATLLDSLWDISE